MKEGIHPNYREVVFVDLSNDFSFVTRSTVSTKETIKWRDGKENGHGRLYKEAS
ncbi:MAG: 50S ribosomal protein L31, partial [Burkholderiaceae bacterium]